MIKVDIISKNTNRKWNSSSHLVAVIWFVESNKHCTALFPLCLFNDKEYIKGLSKLIRTRKGLYIKMCWSTESKIERTKMKPLYQNVFIDRTWIRDQTKKRSMRTYTLIIIILGLLESLSLNFSSFDKIFILLRCLFAPQM